MKSNRIDLLDLTLGKTYKKCLQSEIEAEITEDE